LTLSLTLLQVLGTTASFKRMPVIKEGMYTIKSNPQVIKQRELFEAQKWSRRGWFYSHVLRLWGLCGMEAYYDI